MAPPRNNLLFAHMALNLVPDLSSAARRVGSAILDHFNHSTTQCDPSIERLAELLDMNRATVMRATEQLCKAGWFVRKSHGGKSHRTRYIPQWAAMTAFIDDWNARMKTGSGLASRAAAEAKTAPESPVETAVPNVAEMRPLTSQKCDLDSRRNATRTVLTNRPKETGPSIPAVTALPHGQTKAPKNRVQKVMRPSGQYAMLLPIDGGKAAIARTAAERRLNTDLMRDKVQYAALVPEITDALYNAAVSAELKTPGSGRTSVLAGLGSLMAERKA